jgi:hypothetical protein
LIKVALLLLAMAIPAATQDVAAPHVFVSQACGFRVELPADWKIRSSRSKKCGFTVILGNKAADEGLDLVVRDGNLDPGANNIGFAKDTGKWMLTGEETVEAVGIESKSWVGLQGTVGSRIYEHGHYSGFGDQTRALLFDRGHRIAEVMCFSGEEAVPRLVKGFEFLTASKH